MRALQVPLMPHGANIVVSIPPSKEENEQYLSLSGIYSDSCHVRFSANTIYSLLFISSNSSILTPNPYIELFDEFTDSTQKYN